MTFPSKRSGINLNIGSSGSLGTPEHDSLVDMLRGGANFGPFGGSYNGATMWNADCCDDITGFPNTAATRALAFGGFGVYMVASTEFSGKRVLTWSGDGEFIFSTGTWTVDTALSSNYAEVSNGRYTGTNPYIVITYTGAGGGISSRFIQHDRSSNGSYITAAHFYRLEDEARFQAGKVFRAGYLQNYVALNPGYVRFVNSSAINNSLECRYEHHTDSRRHALGGSNLLACDTYGEIAGGNAYTVANTAGSPAAMQHGEVVIGRVTTTGVRGGAKTVTGITKANPGVVTSTAHGFSDGDVVIGLIAGMTELNLKPCTVANQTANTFELSGVDTTAYGTFTSGTYQQYITLNRDSLGAYPIVFEDSALPASYYSSTCYMSANDYKTFSFDKYAVASTLVNGAWIFSNQGSTPKIQGIAPEILAQFMVELNELQVAQSTAAAPLGPTDMWICVPHRGLLSVDPDYTLASHYGIGMVDDILNGANGYSGLPARCSLIVEGSNEDWNAGGTSFSQTPYQARLGYLRYGGSTTDYQSYSTVRKIVLANDLKTAFPAHAQLKYVICGQGTLGVSAGNSTRIYGNANIDGDAWNTWGGDPIAHFDGFAWASYFLAGSTYDTANLTTLAASYAAAGTDAAREAVCRTYAYDGVINSGASETIARYRDTLLPAYASAMTTAGKYAMQYEGGWDRAISGSAEVQTFLTAVKASQGWADALRTYFDAWPSVTDAYYPADYIMIDARWGHCTPDTYLGGVEGANLDLAWRQIADYNNDLAAVDVPATVSSGGGGAARTNPKDIKANEERKKRLKKNQDDIEQTIRLAYQRLTGKVTEPPVLKDEPSPVKLAVHAEKLAKQLVEKSKTAKQRTRNKEIIADLQRQANAIMQEEEEAIVSLLFH